MAHYAPFSDIHVLMNERAAERDVSVLRRCLSPRSVSLTDASGVHIASQLVRCRKCAGCLKLRQHEWMRRATIEFLSHERSWWVTYTFRPGAEFNPYTEIQLSHKLLRKAFQFRFVCSEENGERNGRKHFHVLYHGPACSRRRDFEAVWGHGFVHTRLARSAGLGAYLAKYASKAGRIRASLHYGDALRAAHRVRPEIAAQIESYLSGKLPCCDYVASVSRFGIRLLPDAYTRVDIHGQSLTPF